MLKKSASIKRDMRVEGGEERKGKGEKRVEIGLKVGEKLRWKEININQLIHTLQQVRSFAMHMSRYNKSQKCSKKSFSAVS